MALPRSEAMSLCSAGLRPKRKTAESQVQTEAMTGGHGKSMEILSPSGFGLQVPLVAMEAADVL